MPPRGADFLHLMWHTDFIFKVFEASNRKTCQLYWLDQFHVLLRCVLGLLEDEIWPRHTKILMQEMLFLSQKQIAVRWMQVAPPPVNQWMKAVDQILPYKKKNV